MKRLAFLMVLFAVPAHATEPPAEWLDKPYSGTIGVVQLEPEMLKDICTSRLGEFEDMGCAVVIPDYCGIWIRNDLPPLEYDLVLRHETAHCKGWPQSHPLD